MFSQKNVGIQYFLISSIKQKSKESKLWIYRSYMYIVSTSIHSESLVLFAYTDLIKLILAYFHGLSFDHVNCFWQLINVIVGQQFYAKFPPDSHRHKYVEGPQSTVTLWNTHRFLSVQFVLKTILCGILFKGTFKKINNSYQIICTAIALCCGVTITLISFSLS